MERMADAIAEGARSAGAEVAVERVPELVPEEVALKAGAKLDQAAPIASPQELDQYDAIIVGAPTRYGRMAAQMANFWDQTGGLWARGALVGKVGSAFASTAAQHGGQETTLMAIHTQMFHHGMVQVGLPYAAAGQMRMDEITGPSPYGVTTLARSDGKRMPRARTSWSWRAGRAATWRRSRRGWRRYRPRPGRGRGRPRPREPGRSAAAGPRPTEAARPSSQRHGGAAAEGRALARHLFPCEADRSAAGPVSPAWERYTSCHGR